jgi:hypothetical protein
MKNLYLFLFFSFIIIRVNSQDVTRYTPTGVSVYAERTPEIYSEAYLLAKTLEWQDFIDANDWNATILAPCSSIYNCHGYAWHMSDGGDTIWMPNDWDVSKYYNGIGGQNATYKRVDSPSKYGKVYYNGASHSAIVYPDNTSKVISKWGSAPLVCHFPEHAPYDDYTLEYYELIIDDQPSSVAKGCAVNVSTLNIDSATYNWSALNNYVCAAGTTFTGSVTGLNTTMYTKGQVKVEIASPYSNTTVKGIKEFTVTSAPSNPYITGPAQVCSSGGTFTLNNVPPGNTITWSHSSNLSTSTVHANPCTFTAVGSGTGWVKATVSTACSSSTFTINQFNVWIGVPVISYISGPTYTPNYQWSAYYAQPNNSLMGATDYSWALSPSRDNVIYDYGWTADIAFYTSDTYQLVARAQNACGWGNYAMTYVEVYDSKRLAIFPNPASGEVTLTIEMSDGEELPVSGWDLEIYAPNTMLKEKKTTLKDNKTNINTSGWQEGIYMVRVKFGDRLLSGKLIVER